MAKLSKIFEKKIILKSKIEQTQRLIIVAEADSKEDAENLGYDDFECNLYINGKFIADISAVLDGANLLTDLIDSVDWVGVYAELQYSKEF